ncbi:hypothetical protein [Umezawaea sp.]|uniref:SH3 domain-containing protein n=1 Tax=Umezawaea sp. TaxID=1955258 RepID=UPI002ED28C87
MRLVKFAVTALLTAAAVLGGGAAAMADPAAVTGQGGIGDPPQYRVTAWHQVNVRQCPASSCAKAGYLSAGGSTSAYCYTHGEPITDFGITRDIWVLIGHQDGGNQFVNALYLEGDMYGNLPPMAYCHYVG